MIEETSNDNDRLRTAALVDGQDPNGQAALLLVESLLHGLVARAVISVEDAVEIVDIAAEVKQDTAEDLGDSPATLKKSLTILGTLSASLKSDISQ